MLFMPKAIKDRKGDQGMGLGYQFNERVRQSEAKSTTKTIGTQCAQSCFVW